MVKTTRSQEGMDETYGLRVAVMGGGCSGFQYALDFDQEPRETDTVCDPSRWNSSTLLRAASSLRPPAAVTACITVTNGPAG